MLHIQKCLQFNVFDGLKMVSKKIKCFQKHKNSNMCFSFSMKIKALQKPIFKYIHMFVIYLYKNSIACLCKHYSP